MVRKWKSGGGDRSTEHRQHSVGMVEWCWNGRAEQEQKLTTPNPSLERRGALEEWYGNGSVSQGQKCGAGMMHKKQGNGNW